MAREKKNVDEKKYEVRVFQVVWPCEICDRGEMERVTSHGGQHAIIRYDIEHKCNVCGNTDSVRKKSYPFIKYERITPPS